MLVEKSTTQPWRAAGPILALSPASVCGKPGQKLSLQLQHKIAARCQSQGLMEAEDGAAGGGVARMCLDCAVVVGPGCLTRAADLAGTAGETAFQHLERKLAAMRVFIIGE
jgi:hypothetical protein